MRQLSYFFQGLQGFFVGYGFGFGQFINYFGNSPQRGGERMKIRGLLAENFQCSTCMQGPEEGDKAEIDLSPQELISQIKDDRKLLIELDKELGLRHRESEKGGKRMKIKGHISDKIDCTVDISPAELAEQMTQEDWLELIKLAIKPIPDTCTCASNQGNGTICTNCGKPLSKKEDICTCKGVYHLPENAYCAVCLKPLPKKEYIHKDYGKETLPQVPSELPEVLDMNYLMLKNKVNEIIKFLREGR